MIELSFRPDQPTVEEAKRYALLTGHEKNDEHGGAWWASVPGEPHAGVMTWVKPGPSRVAHLKSVAVAPAHRRQGIGTALIHQAIDQATALGAEQIAVDAGGAPLAFWQSCGFTGDPPRLKRTLPRPPRATAYAERGFTSPAEDLADPSVIEALLRDEPLFQQAVDQLRAEGRASVPYLLTEAIRQVAQDAAILRTVVPILGSDEWVMWGANIRRATPNEAHRWHVDLESFLWPTVTVAVGLSGCPPESATWCIPGSHRLSTAPTAAGDDTDTRRVVAKANCGEPEQIAGFGNGRFYLLDARVWHQGNPATSRDRVALFLHYQRASEPRIPAMRDYRRHDWSKEPAAYFAAPGVNEVNQSVYQPPLAHRLRSWLSR